MKYITAIIIISGLIVFSIALANLIAYWHGSAWQLLKYGVVPMAVNTSVLFCLVGLALLLIGKKLNEK